MKPVAVVGLFLPVHSDVKIHLVDEQRDLRLVSLMDADSNDVHLIPVLLCDIGQRGDAAHGPHQVAQNSTT